MSKGYEIRDVRGKPMLALLLALILSSLALLTGTGILLRQMKSDIPGAEQPARKPTVKDLRGYLSSENKKLNSYGWIDRKANRVHIPVTRAMEIYVSR